MMNPSLFEILPTLQRRLKSASTVLVISDFDGTLTPIMPRPEVVQLAPEPKHLLKELAKWGRVVIAILSGRALDDVRQRVGVDGLIYAGNHGLEIRGPKVSFVEPTAAALAPSLRELVDELHKVLASFPGVLVENKHLTASVHVRQASKNSWEEVRETVESLVESWGGGFRVKTGHAVFEIFPPVSWNKGAAALWIKDHCAADADLITILGDDRTDEDAFLALPEAVTVKIGEHTTTAARYWLHSPSEVVVFLSWLLKLTEGKGGVGS
jgi:trehalose-phosphatase